MRFVLTLTRITLFEALRTRLAWLALGIAVLVLGLTQFLNQVAITESREIQIAFASAALRAAAVFLLAAFVITSSIRESNDKIIDLLLSQPVPRSAYFYGKFIGFGLVALALAALCGLTLAPFAPGAGLVAWTASLAGELWVVASIALFCALSIPQVVTAFAATAGFYLLARSVEAMQLIASAPLVPNSGIVDTAIRWIVDAIAVAMPALDRLARTSWLIDGAPAMSVITPLAGQTALYVVLIGAASLFDLHRKSF